MSEVVFELRPDGNDLRVVVLVDGVEVKDVKKTPLVLDDAQLNELRAGQPSPVTAGAVATALSDWFFADGVGDRLGALLDAESARVAFRITRGAHEVRLADFPFELLQLHVNQPVVLNDNVRSVIHLLQKVPGKPAPVARSWPLRILVVRSNPGDFAELVGSVPMIGPLVDAVRAMAIGRYGALAVEISALSREAAIGTPVTWDAVRERLTGANAPDLFVYVGHSHLADGVDGPRTAKLQFESADGAASEPVDAATLRGVLARVPVVVLAGCLTAHVAPDQQKKEKDLQHVPEWMRANQGIAQALVNSSSGVAIAVGMRYRLRDADAPRLVKTFFESLLLDQPGDVEAAVHAARKELAESHFSPPGWSAPVLFRNVAPEPTFDFLRRPPRIPSALDERDQQLREKAWVRLGATSHAERLADQAAGKVSFADEVIADAEQGVIERSLQAHTPVMMPARVERPAGAVATVSITLKGPLSIKKLRGRVLVDDPTLVVTTRPMVPPALAQAGFTLLTGVYPPNALHFEIAVAPNQQGARPVPEGTLFDFDVKLGDIVPTVHLLRVEIDEIRDQAPLFGWNNVIVVMKP